MNDDRPLPPRKEEEEEEKENKINSLLSPRTDLHGFPRFRAFHNANREEPFAKDSAPLPINCRYFTQAINELTTKGHRIFLGTFLPIIVSYILFLLLFFFVLFSFACLIGERRDFGRGTTSFESLWFQRDRTRLCVYNCWHTFDDAIGHRRIQPVRRNRFFFFFFFLFFFVLFLFLLERAAVR